MLISPKVLNLHQDATWQQEFGISPSELKKQFMRPTVSMLEVLGAIGVYVKFFTNKPEPAEFCLGETLLQADLFQMLQASGDKNSAHNLYTAADKNLNFTQLKDKAIPLDVGYCLVISFNDANNGIYGFCAFYGESLSLPNKSLRPVVQLYQQAILSDLAKQKYHRLNIDREELQELIADTQTHAIFAKDTEYRIMCANAKFMSFYPPELQSKVIGYTTLEDYDKKQTDLFLENDRLAFSEGINTVIETIDFPSGEQKVLETTKKRFTTQAGGDYILGIAYDLTKEYDLIRLLQMKNKDLDQVANMLATEVRAPANAMVKLIKWLEDDLSHIENEEIQENLGQLKLRAARISKLLAALYQYCFAGRDKHVNSSVSLTTIVSDILSSLRNNVAVETEIEDSILDIPHSPFSAVLSVLIDNAIVHNVSENKKLIVDYLKENNHHIVSVADNGKGINAELADQVFRLFYSTKEAHEDAAFGLGLALARKIVESYRGSIELDHEYGDGAKFILRWPCS